MANASKKNVHISYVYLAHICEGFPASLACSSKRTNYR